MTPKIHPAMAVTPFDCRYSTENNHSRQEIIKGNVQKIKLFKALFFQSFSFLFRLNDVKDDGKNPTEIYTRFCGLFF